MEEQTGVLIVTRHSALRALASHKMRKLGHAVLYDVPRSASPCGFCTSLVPTPVMALVRRVSSSLFPLLPNYDDYLSRL
jgi:hypothetical protein